MKIKRLFWTIPLTAALAPSLAAQTAPVPSAGQTQTEAASPMPGAPAPDSSPAQAIFAPFVSRLQGEVKNKLVRLSWVDSPDVRGPVYIYRSTRPFEAPEALSGIAPAEVAYGVQAFVDEFESETTLYYFAAASDEAGRRYNIPIIFNNTISMEIAEGGSSVIVQGTPSAAAAPQERGIFSLEAAARGESVILTFAGINVKNAALYRSIRPIAKTQDLLGAVIVQTKINSPFTDYPVPGIPYYYAVIPEEDLIRGTLEIIPGRNATLTPAAASVEGSGNTLAFPNIRPMPLPLVSAQTASGLTVYETPSAGELSPEAAKALAGIPAAPESGPVLKKARVFARDLDAQAGGEEYALGSIVSGAFTAKNWEKAKEELAGFLALPRSPEAKIRARFYLGQCCYFLRQPQEGLFEFLAIQDRYPQEANEWIQASLDMMKE